MEPKSAAMGVFGTGDVYPLGSGTTFNMISKLKVCKLRM
jgi:hypothetical protein